jgi:hypothetical protein
MAKNWRGYRPFVLDGRRFRWACRFHYPVEMLSASYGKRGSTWRPDTLLVRPEDGPQRSLRVTWPACFGPIVKPAVVRVCIEEGLRRGWLSEHRDLELKGEEFLSAEANAPDHSLVDVVREIVAGRRPNHPNFRKLD